MREVVNGHLATSPLAELSTELVEDEALCSGLVSNGLGRVHDTPGLVAVVYLGCYPIVGELGGRGVGRRGKLELIVRGVSGSGVTRGGGGYGGGGRGFCISVLC